MELHGYAQLEWRKRGSYFVGVPKSILRRCSAEEIVGAGEDGRLICAWLYGDLYVLEAIGRQLGIDAVMRQQAGTRPLGFDVERALFARVANRACAPASQLYGHEQWLKEDAHIEGTQGLKLHTLSRAMDFLEANKPSSTGWPTCSTWTWM